MLLSSSLLLLAVVYAGQVAAGEIGFRIGRRFRARTDDQARRLEEGVQTASLGLLALLLGFSFSLTASRYDIRRDVVVREANAIGTAYLRVQLLPDPERSESRELLRRYVAERIGAYDLGTGAAVKAEILSKELQDALWARTVTVAREERVSAILAASVVQALNEVDVSSEAALTAFEDKLPPEIMRLLLAMAAIAAGVTGYCGCCAGLTGRRLLLVIAVQPLLVAAVITAIADIDEPFRGSVRVSENALVRVKAGMR